MTLSMPTGTAYSSFQPTHQGTPLRQYVEELRRKHEVTPFRIGCCGYKPFVNVNHSIDETSPAILALKRVAAHFVTEARIQCVRCKWSDVAAMLEANKVHVIADPVMPSRARPVYIIPYCAIEPSYVVCRMKQVGVVEGHIRAMSTTPGGVVSVKLRRKWEAEMNGMANLGRGLGITPGTVSEAIVERLRVPKSRVKYFDDQDLLQAASRACKSGYLFMSAYPTAYEVTRSLGRDDYAMVRFCPYHLRAGFAVSPHSLPLEELLLRGNDVDSSLRTAEGALLGTYHIRLLVGTERHRRAILSDLDPDIYVNGDPSGTLWDLMRPPQALFDVQAGKQPGNLLLENRGASEPRALLGYPRQELVCGDNVLVLKQALEVEQRAGGGVYLPQFDIALVGDDKQETIARAAIRKFRDYEGRAARALLSGSDFELWKRMCETVDRAATVRRREARIFVRTLGQVLSKGGAVKVRWSSGQEVRLKPEVARSLEIQNEGEWFEANVLNDEEGAVAELTNVDPRPDYRAPTDQDIDRFFGIKREGGRG